MLKTNFIDMLNDTLFENRARRLGAFTDLRDGAGIVDMDIMNASANRFRIALVALTVGASVVGKILGSRNR